MKQRDRSESITHHFCHKHKLNLCNFGKHSILAFCCCCNLHLNNCSAYCCIDCRFFIHESCLNMQQEVQHPLHPQHPLCMHALINNESKMCDSYDELVKGISLRCTDCEFYVHIACRNPFTRTLKHKCHEHDVVYFLRSNTLLQCFECNKCHAYCSDSFYRCNECNLNLHLECIPLPGVMRHKFHKLHPLTLVDSVKDYNCNVYKKGRNPDDHVYYCEQCAYLAHIECVISEDDASPEILSYAEPRFKDEDKQNDDSGTVMMKEDGESDDY